MTLKVEKTREEPDVTIIAVTGIIALGQETAPLRDGLLESLRVGDKKIVLDFSNVTRIDSAGIGIVASSYAKLSQAGGEMRLVGATPMVEQVFHITRLDSLIPLFPNVPAAVASFGARQPA